MSLHDKRFKLLRVGKPDLLIIACWRARYYSFNFKLLRGSININFIQFIEYFSKDRRNILNYRKIQRVSNYREPTVVNNTITL